MESLSLCLFFTKIKEKDEKIEELEKKILDLEAYIHSKLGQKDSDQDSFATNSEVENIIREAFEAVEDSDTSEEASSKPGENT